LLLILLLLLLTQVGPGGTLSEVEVDLELTGHLLCTTHNDLQEAHAVPRIAGLRIDSSFSLLLLLLLLLLSLHHSGHFRWYIE
jgi:hypothetical protein